MSETAVTETTVTFTDVEGYEFVRGRVAEPNPYEPIVEELYKQYESTGSAPTKGATLDSAEEATRLIGKLRAAGRKVGCTILADVSEPNKQGKVAVRWTVRQKIVRKPKDKAA